MDRSIRRLGGFLILLFCALFAQLNYIQVFRADKLNHKTGNTRPIDQAFSRERGSIATADGVVVARSVKSGDRYQFQREYPHGEAYAHLTGYFNYSFGATGIESAYNEELSGDTTRQQFRAIGDLFVDKDRSGDVTMTIRSDVQAKAIEALGGRRGSVVALDPRNGNVLALWSFPSFDPNLLSSHDIPATERRKAVLENAPGKPLLAKTYREIFPPGSTFKVVTAAAGVQSGKVSVTEPTYPVLRALDLPQTDRDLRNFGSSSCGGALFEIVAESCNTAFAQMGLDLGGDVMVETSEAFGFNTRPPLDLPAVASQFPEGPFDQELPVLATSSIGQGRVAATPLQMALVAAGIAHGGEIMGPHVVDRIIDGEGDQVLKNDPTVWRRAVSPQTAEIIREGMRQVVNQGTATRLQIPGLDVGAKTGTAQFGPAEPLQSHAWVIAWAGPPGQEPTVAVAVIVEGQDGASEQTGGRVAAPIAKEVIEQAMRPMPPPPEDEGRGAGSSSTTSTTSGG